MSASTLTTKTKPKSLSRLITSHLEMVLPLILVNSFCRQPFGYFFYERVLKISKVLQKCKKKARVRVLTRFPTSSVWQAVKRFYAAFYGYALYGAFKYATYINIAYVIHCMIWEIWYIYGLTR